MNEARARIILAAVMVKTTIVRGLIAGRLKEFYGKADLKVLD